MKTFNVKPSLPKMQVWCCYETGSLLLVEKTCSDWKLFGDVWGYEVARFEKSFKEKYELIGDFN